MTEWRLWARCLPRILFRVRGSGASGDATYLRLTVSNDMSDNDEHRFFASQVAPWEMAASDRMAFWEAPRLEAV